MVIDPGAAAALPQALMLFLQPIDPGVMQMNGSQPARMSDDGTFELKGGREGCAST